ncbi:MAG TPA: hypothetical protein VF771_16055 [Longimicrobiaceae bacterium]
MPFIDRRTRRGPGRFLQWKIRLIAVGAVLLLVGMARELDLLVLLSLIFLGGAFILRFFEKDEREEVPAEEEENEPDSWPPRRRETDLEEDAERRVD